MIETNLLTGKHVSLRAIEPEDLEILYTLVYPQTVYCQRNSRHLYRQAIKTDDRIS